MDTTPAFDNPIALTQYVNKCVLPNLDDTLTADLANDLHLGFNSAATGIYKVALSDFNDNVSIQTETFDGQHQEHICPRDYAQIEDALLRMGAHPIEP